MTMQEADDRAARDAKKWAAVQAILKLLADLKDKELADEVLELVKRVKLIPARLPRGAGR
jgi:hypothetical protein